MIERIKKINERMLKKQMPSTIRMSTYEVLKRVGEVSVITIKGFRQVGKTVGLIQLLQELTQQGEKAIYIDGEVIKTGYDDIVEALIDEGYTYFLIDEACKVTEYDVLVATIRFYSMEAKFILTGSSSLTMKNLSDSIGRGITLTYMPNTYYEYILFKKFPQMNFKDNPYQTALSLDTMNELSSKETLYAYCYDGFEASDKTLEYLVQNIHDCLVSNYLRNKIDIIEVTTDEIETVLTVLSYCIIYQYRTGKELSAKAFKELGFDLKQLQVAVNPVIFNENFLAQLIKEGFMKIGKKKFLMILNFLERLDFIHISGEVRSFSEFITHLEAHTIKSLDICVKTLDLTYYVYAKFLRGIGLEKHQVKDLLLGNSQVKGNIMEQVHLSNITHIVPNFDVYKYRDAAEQEIDIIINSPLSKIGIEVKDRPNNNIDISYLRDRGIIWDYLKQQIQLNYFLLTNSDFTGIRQSIPMVRNDILLLYMNTIIYSEMNIVEAVERLLKEIKLQ